MYFVEIRCKADIEDFMKKSGKSFRISTKYISAKYLPIISASWVRFFSTPLNDRKNIHRENYVFLSTPLNDRTLRVTFVSAPLNDRGVSAGVTMGKNIVSASLNNIFSR